jgi:hypothetical protein
MSKLTTEELESIKLLQSKYNQTIFEIGVAEAQRIALQEQVDKLQNTKVELVNDLATIEKQESDLVTSLQTKYGNGAINPETGEITPA